MEKVISKILGMILSVLMFTLLLSFYGKAIFTGFMTNVLSDLNTNIVDVEFGQKNNNDDTNVTISKNFTVNDLFNSPEYKKVLKDKEVQKMISKYVDITINGVVNPNTLDDVDLQDDLITFLLENKDRLKSKYNINITDKDIKDFQETPEYTELNDKFINSIKDSSSNLSSGQKSLIKGFLTVCSTGFKIVLMIIILVLLVLIGIIEKSIYKSIKTLGLTLISSGVLTIILGLIVNFSLKSMIGKLNMKMSINFMDICKIGLIATIIGTVIVVVSYLIKKRIDKNNIDELYKEVSNGFEEDEDEENKNKYLLSSDDE